MSFKFWLILPAPLLSHLLILLSSTVPFRPQGSILFHFVLLFPPLPYPLEVPPHPFLVSWPLPMFTAAQEHWFSNEKLRSTYEEEQTVFVSLGMCYFT